MPGIPTEEAVEADVPEAIRTGLGEPERKCRRSELSRVTKAVPPLAAVPVVVGLEEAVAVHQVDDGRRTRLIGDGLQPEGAAAIGGDLHLALKHDPIVNPQG